ncbi:MAG: hypothetical protein M3040_15440 [Bacteroidota bacterium]|nr:hypothetical protein [Bacteroidota bacterium]
MKKKILITVNLVLLTMFALHAQDKSSNKKSGIAISLGAAANYYYGPGDRNFGDFENERVNWQLNSMLGVTLARDKNDRRTMLAAFGAFGFNNASTVSHILSDENYITSQIGGQRNTNNFYQLEGGLLIAEILRISTGVGQQNFDKQILVNTNGTIIPKATSLMYNSTTVGFNFNFSAVVLNINANFASGKDFEKTLITPSAGVMLRF